MLRHNLLLIFRNSKRSKSSFIINLIGLSTGLACTLLIYLWVNSELSFDKFHENDSLLFQIMQNAPGPTGIETMEATPGLLAQALAEEIPEVEFSVSVIPASWFSSKGILSFEDKYVTASEQFVGKDYFKMFSCEFVHGDKKQMISDKYSIAISDEMANKLFNTESVIGKAVTWNRGVFNGQYIISGVFKKHPSISSPFDLIFNYELFLDKRQELLEWQNSDPNTYVMLKQGTDIDQFINKISGFIKSKYEKSKSTLFARHYSDAYLYGWYENGIQSGGRIEYVKLFSIIAIFILGIACINFMNLSTARASKRLKEIGIKKVVGASRRGLIAQYLTESLVTVFISIGIALALTQLFLPVFNDMTGKQLMITLDVNLITTSLGIALITGIVAGSYPALFLSGFKPIQILKGKLNSTLGEILARKGLVTFQFVISIILIVAVVVVYKQMEFVQSKNLGFNKDNIIYFSNTGKLREGGLEAFLSEIKSISGVISASSFSHNLTGEHGGTTDLEWDGKSHDEIIEFGNLEVDYGLIELMGFEMLQGRTFSNEFGSEGDNLILNEAAIVAMGLKDPIGKTVKLWGKDKQIVGVVKNFHFESLYEKVKPCFMQCSPNRRNVLVKLRGGSAEETIPLIRASYHEYNPGLPFEYTFLDEDYKLLYASEQRVAKLSRYFALVAILISCLGLFGLAAFTAERRIKEIGIRKVLGSSVLNIVILLSSDFTKIILLSIAIALPLSYLIAKDWLDNFAYHIKLELWYFASTAMVALLISWLTVGAQTIKSAMTNPVNNLRTE